MRGSSGRLTLLCCRWLGTHPFGVLIVVNSALADGLMSKAHLKGSVPSSSTLSMPDRGSASVKSENYTLFERLRPLTLTCTAWPLMRGSPSSSPSCNITTLSSKPDGSKRFQKATGVADQQIGTSLQAPLYQSSLTLPMKHPMMVKLSVRR